MKAKTGLDVDAAIANSGEEPSAKEEEKIKAAVEKTYNVTVVGISTAVVKGKVKSRYTKAGIITGSTSDYKKAIVALKEGDTIDFYSNI